MSALASASKGLDGFGEGEGAIVLAGSADASPSLKGTPLASTTLAESSVKSSAWTFGSQLSASPQAKFRRRKASPAGPLARLLDSVEAHKATIPAAPAFSMAPRHVESISWSRPESNFGGPSLNDLEQTTKEKAPMYTMRSKGPSEAPFWNQQPPSWVPGPGAYETKGTLQKSHPTQHLSGRGFHFGSSERPNVTGSGSGLPTPSPEQLPALSKGPAFSIAKRCYSSPVMAMQRSRSPAPTEYSMPEAGKVNSHRSPSWGFVAAFGSMSPRIGVETSGGALRCSPGPAEYHFDRAAKAAGTRREPCHAFGSSRRFPRNPPLREY